MGAGPVKGLDGPEPPTLVTRPPFRFDKKYMLVNELKLTYEITVKINAKSYTSISEGAVGCSDCPLSQWTSFTQSSITAKTTAE